MLLGTFLLSSGIAWGQQQPSTSLPDPPPVAQPEAPKPSFIMATPPGTYRVGDVVSPPALLYKVEPEYTEEARQAHLQGVVVLSVEVDANGKAVNPRVVRSLGYGLDQKAIEAVGKWNFRPSYKDGKPATVAATIEVNFRLSDNPSGAPLLQSFGGAIVSTTPTSTPMGGIIHQSPRRFVGSAITGRPYSAQRETEHVQIAADGTRFTTNNQQETIYRDSQGRTRTERPIMRSPANGPKPTGDVPLLIEISDPVANVGYTLDTQNKVCHRYAFEPIPRPGVMPSGGGSGGAGAFGGVITAGLTPGANGNVPESLQMKREDLGMQMIEGVLAKGERQVRTWPAGSQGSDRSFQTTSENWVSEDLKVTILSRNVDPRNGENTTKLINIRLGEPPADLFAPPADYTVVDETGPFEIHWTVPAR
jgi:TonB family protein